MSNTKRRHAAQSQHACWGPRAVRAEYAARLDCPMRAACIAHRAELIVCRPDMMSDGEANAEDPVVAVLEQAVALRKTEAARWYA